MKKSVIILLSLFSMAAMADSLQNAVEVSSDIQRMEGQATLWLEVKELDSNKVEPYSLPLMSGNNYHIIPVTDMHYQVIAAMVQTPSGQQSPCAIPPQVITNQVLALQFSGEVGPNAPPLACYNHFTSGVVVADTSSSSGSSNASAASLAPVSSKDSNPYMGVVDYLTNLQSCKESQSAANINNHLINYLIKGRVGAKCRVLIKVAGVKETINCQFTPADIKKLSSDAQIAMYRSQKVNPALKNQASQVMDVSCSNV